MSNITEYRNKDALFIKMSEATERYRMCRNSVYKLAKESNALLKIGRAVLIDANMLDAYIKNRYIQH